MKTFRRLTCLFLCLFMLAGCAWTDQLLLMARAGKAFASLQSVKTEVDVKMEGNLSQKLIQIPFVLSASGTMDIDKEPRSFTSRLQVSGGNDLFQIPFDLNQQWKQTEQGWQKYDFIRKQWVSCTEPALNQMLDFNPKDLIALLNAGELSWIKNDQGDKQAVISFILQAGQVNDFLTGYGANPDLVSMLAAIDEYKLSLMLDFNTGLPMEIDLYSLSTVPVDKTSGFEAVLQQFSLRVSVNEWIR